MDDNTNIETYTTAIQDFRRARSRANLKELLSRLTGEPTQLLSYEEVRKKLNLLASIERGLKDIPLDAIVGSVGRYTDFTRDFLPREEVSPERWARVKVIASGLTGLPPIDVYLIGEAYFVRDGNHRVSVARQLGAKSIQAYVTEVHTRVPLTPDVQPDDLILKAEYLNFLEQTRLDKLRPQSELIISVPGRYQELLEHIEVHRYFMGIDYQREIPYEDAATHWHDTIYIPIVEIIQSQGILRNFPERTETDLYLWIARHRDRLEEQLGWKIRAEYAAENLVEGASPLKGKLLSRIGSKLFDIFLPDALESGPPVGSWRAQALSKRPDDRLFADLLVPVNGKEDGWCALEQALVVADREGAILHGLYVAPEDAEQDSTTSQEVKDEFNRRCAQASIQGELMVTIGDVSHQICFHASGADLIITNLSFPPGSTPLARLSSGFRELIQRCPRPVLATPNTISPLNRALLAYDGSLKAREALYVATYLVSKWGIPLVVLCVTGNDGVEEQTINQAKDYLEEHGAAASYNIQSGPVAETILQVHQDYKCDFIIIGGYGQSPVREVVLGSIVDKLLQESSIPMLICR